MPLSQENGQRAAKLTHGRHCPCSACAQQDWAEPRLAPCGMHGASCPGVYAPIDAPLGSWIEPDGRVSHVDRVHAQSVKVIEQRDELVRWLAIKCRPADAKLIEERITELTNEAVKLGAELIA